MSAEADDFLEHFGVKDMKWGRRKAGGSDTIASTKKAPIDRAKLKAARKEVIREAAAGLGAHKKRNAGIALASGILLGPGGAMGVASVAAMRSQGHSRGKSAILGYLGGPIGGLVVGEQLARKRARES